MAKICLTPMHKCKLTGSMGCIRAYVEDEMGEEIHTTRPHTVHLCC
uniref:Uncharacterized protein n=1 Tax=Triticum urartu TaxID=4572 RepID=A0A8R7QFY1_TRIUA